jgi:outer membrane receptor protein involved in Fe transport
LTQTIENQSLKGVFMNKKSIHALSGLALAVAVASSGIGAAELEEIIVTAQKRAESLQDVPMSMSAISGERIEEAGMQSLADMSEFIPNFTIEYNATNSIISMRGIGVGANQAFEQSVGTYVDGIHYGRSRQVRSGLFDVEQLEVLRGPQGVLFGKNTLAGALNITTATPDADEELGGKIALSMESNGGQVAEGHITGSIGDTLGMRFAFKELESDGYNDNTYPGAFTSKLPVEDSSLWRASVTWEPTDSTRVELKHMESDEEVIGENSVVTLFSPVANMGAASQFIYGVMGAAFPNYASLIAAGNYDAYSDAGVVGGCEMEAIMGKSSAECAAGLDKPKGTLTSNANTSLSFEMVLDNGYTLNANAGRTRYDYQDGLDADWLPLRFIGQATFGGFDANSQEFRISSPTDGKFSWVGGVYLNKSTQTQDQLTSFDGTFGVPGIVSAILGVDSLLSYNPTQVAGLNATLLAPGTPYTLDQLYAATGLDYRLQWGLEGQTKWREAGRVSFWETDTNSKAVFYQGTFNLTDTLSLTAGARYTEEDKRAYKIAQNTTSVGGLGIPYNNPLYDALSAALFSSYAHEFKDQQRSSKQFIPSVNMEWNRSEDSMFYISYAEGFKSGGFNATDSQLPLFTADGIQPNMPGPGYEFDDENAESVEIGGKHTLMDGEMTLNWAIYDSTYENQQVSTFVGLGFVVTNAASTGITGLEVDWKWQATDNLMVGANIALNDGAYNAFPGAACTALQASDLAGGATSSGSCVAEIAPDGTQIGISQNLAGGQQGTKHSGALMADYSRPVMGGLLWISSIDVNFTDGYFMTGDLDPIDYQDGFTKTNLRTSLRGENWTAMLYGKNVTDERVATGAADVPLSSGSHFEYGFEGAVWGASLSYNF